MRRLVLEKNVPRASPSKGTFSMRGELPLKTSPIPGTEAHVEQNEHPKIESARDWAEGPAESSRNEMGPVTRCRALRPHAYYGQRETTRNRGIDGSRGTTGPPAGLG